MCFPVKRFRTAASLCIRLSALWQIAASPYFHFLSHFFDSTMTSADFSQFAVATDFIPCFHLLVRSPRVRTITFLPCNRCIYLVKFGQYWTSLCFASSSASRRPYMHFLFVGSGLCLRLPSDSTSRWTPLPLANSSYCQACSGLAPPSYRPCRAHKQ